MKKTNVYTDYFSEKDNIHTFREFVIDKSKIYTGYNLDINNDNDFRIIHSSFYESDNKRSYIFASEARSGRDSKLYTLLMEAGLMEDTRVGRTDTELKLEEGNWRFVEYDGQEEEVIDYHYLPYADGIKLFYHYFKSFETYCDKYIPEEYWKTTLGYYIRVKDSGETQTIHPTTLEESKQSGKIWIYGGLGEIPFSEVEITGTKTERTWYENFLKAMPTLEVEYKRLVESGEIDESDVVIYEE